MPFNKITPWQQHFYACGLIQGERVQYGILFIAYQVNTKSYQNDMVTFRNRHDVFTLLIHLGYLAYDEQEQKAFIPNEEIRNEFMDAVEDCSWNACWKRIG